MSTEQTGEAENHKKSRRNENCMVMSSKKFYHNKGQKDASKNRYNRPNDFLFGLFNSTKEAQENDAYDKGWRHGRKKR